jgi:hypothetical protein
MNKKEFLDQFRSQFDEDKSYYSALLTLKKIRQTTGIDCFSSSADSEDFVNFCKENDILITGALIDEPEYREEEPLSDDAPYRCSEITTGWKSLKELFDFEPEDSFYKPFREISDPSAYLKDAQVVYGRMFNMKTTPVLLFTEKILEHIPDIHPEARQIFQPFFVPLKDEMFVQAIHDQADNQPSGVCLNCNAENLRPVGHSTCPVCKSERVVFRRREFPLSRALFPFLRKYAEMLWPPQNAESVLSCKDSSAV